jgi:hypothetical protein
MKITMNVECTPEEARTFLGLPDLKPIQDEVMQEMRNRLMAGMVAMTGFEQMQDSFAKMAGGRQDK